MILVKHLDIFQNLMDSDIGNTYYSGTQVKLRESSDQKSLHRVRRNTESLEIWELSVLNCRKNKKK